MFDSEYAHTEYIEKDGVVFHVWKKEANFENYRTPVAASLELLKAHSGSIFIVDATNGFEDTPEDVKWGFEYFLPELKNTGCKIWGFILPAVSKIEGEIDLWMAEIEKNFKVIRAQSYDEILVQAKGHRITDLFEPDNGCEGFMPGEEPEVTLLLDDGRKIKVYDRLAYEKGWDAGKYITDHDIEKYAR